MVTVFSSIYPQLGHLFQSLEYSGIKCCVKVYPPHKGHNSMNLDISIFGSDM